jgi:uncharacterized membrane protein YfcA
VNEILLVGLGIVVGAAGTLIGAGGGFLLAPLLVFADPADPPAVLTAISLVVVCLNAASGTVAYARMGRVDWRSVWPFVLASLPGAVLGALATRHMDRRVYDPLLGAGLLLLALVIALGLAAPARRPPRGEDDPHPAPFLQRRTLVEVDGTRHAWSFPLLPGLAISAGVGFLSSLLGIGGGVLHVPAMAQLLDFPVHVATATSHAILAFMTLAGVLTHLADGSLVRALPRALPLGAGALVGAQAGARLSNRVSGPAILWGLATALAAVGVRLLLLRV